jgi:hypothetical protein
VGAAPAAGLANASTRAALKSANLFASRAINRVWVGAAKPPLVVRLRPGPDQI